MPKKLKLDLKGLKVNSFVTSLDNRGKGVVMGGRTITIICTACCGSVGVCPTDVTCVTCDTCETCNTDCGSCGTCQTDCSPCATEDCHTFPIKLC